MLILVGQGNPGDKYAKNRHNAGFLVLNHIHKQYGFGPWREKFESDIAEGTVDGVKMLLMKPQTFYNETGRAAAKAAKFYKLTPEAFTIFHDEIDLAPGRMRVKRGGGHSGNNGIRSMIAHLGETVRRVRIGVGHPGDKSMVMPHVLSDFPKSEQDWFVTLAEAISGSLPYLVKDEDERFQTEVMRLAPSPKHDPKQRDRD